MIRRSMTALAVALAIAMPLSGLASSSSRAPKAKSTKASLEGNCPVCLVKMEKVVPGKASYAASYDGHRYLFPGEKQKKMFDANPSAFVPALGGDCVVCKVEMGKDVPGKSEFATIHEGRLYLFPGEKQQKMFEKNPEKYTDADLALGGNCAVCLVKMGDVVAGKAEYVSVHDGLRYLFPGEKQKKMFDENPSAYVPALGGNCTVCQVEKGKTVAGDPKHFVTHGGRLYLFPGEKQKAMFEKNPKKYAAADVALDGNCSVCKVEMGKDVKGNGEFAVDRNGQRYLFPSEKQMKMFLENPEKYVAAN